MMTVKVGALTNTGVDLFKGSGGRNRAPFDPELVALLTEAHTSRKLIPLSGPTPQIEEWLVEARRWANSVKGPDGLPARSISFRVKNDKATTKDIVVQVTTRVRVPRKEKPVQSAQSTAGAGATVSADSGDGSSAN